MKRDIEDEEQLDIEDVRNYLLKRYPHGTIRGQSIKWMPAGQVRAIYYNLTHPKQRVIPGQISLFNDI